LGDNCNFSKDLFNIEEIKQIIKVENDKSLTATKVGSLKCQIIQVDGSELYITPNEVKFFPELWVNLIIFNKNLKNGYDLSNKCLSICLSGGSVSVTFNRVMRTAHSSVQG
jgi:hypothetical protein